MLISHRPRRSLWPLALSLSLLCSGLVTSAQEGKSAAAARQLTELLDRHKLDSIAAADPSAPDTFVAALYFQGGQLLVVSAKYSVPSLLVNKIASKEYRDVYIDLNAASIPGTKIFVMDSGANGLSARAMESQGADTWEQGNKSMVFDGDPRGAKMSEADYTKAFAAADERYAQLLALLAEHAGKGGA